MMSKETQYKVQFEERFDINSYIQDFFDSYNMKNIEVKLYKENGKFKYDIEFTRDYTFYSFTLDIGSLEDSPELRGFLRHELIMIESIYKQGNICKGRDSL